MRMMEMLEKLMAREGAASRLATEKMLALAIPFNAPHGFKLRKLDLEEVRIDLPNNKLNHNHLGGMHACAIATLGEYCAGLTLARHLGLSKYRLIMSELRVQYHMQGRTKLTGVCRFSSAQAEELRQRLLQEEKVTIDRLTVVENTKGEKVAEVTSVWQLKSWEKVRLK